MEIDSVPSYPSERKTASLIPVATLWEVQRLSPPVPLAPMRIVGMFFYLMYI